MKKEELLQKALEVLFNVKENCKRVVRPVNKKWVMNLIFATGLWVYPIIIIVEYYVMHLWHSEYRFLDHPWRLYFMVGIFPVGYITAGNIKTYGSGKREYGISEMH